MREAEVVVASFDLKWSWHVSQADIRRARESAGRGTFTWKMALDHAENVDEVRTPELTRGNRKKSIPRIYRGIDVKSQFTLPLT